MIDTTRGPWLCATGLAALILTLVTSARAVTFVSGTISSNTTWTAGGDNIYEVNGDVTVAAGATLTVQPGVTVRFQQYRGLWIDGTLNAQGTALAPITFTGTTAAKGWWYGIMLQNSGSATLSRCEIAYGGYYNNINLWKWGSGALSLTDSIIRDSSSTALRVQSGYSSFTSARNQFKNSSTGVHLGINASFDDNTSDFSGNTGADVYLDGGTMSSNTTWNLKPAYSMYISGDITVAATATLTVKPGTVVKFAHYAGMNVEGTLSAIGDPLGKISFTDWRDDSVGGDANKNGTADTPGAGWWRSMHAYLGGNLAMTQCDLAYAGYYNEVELWKDGTGSMTLEDTTLRDCAGYGLYLSGSSGTNTITTCTFSGNTRSGMYLNASAVAVLDSSFIDNSDYGLLHEINDTIIYPDNTFSGNGAGSVGVNGGTLNKDLTWTHSIDMVLRGDSTIAAGKTLTIEQGVTVSFQRYVGLWVEGTLTATGEATAPVTFNGTSATPNWWRGIRIYNAGNASFSFCDLAHSGYYDSMTIWKSGSGALSITDSELHHCSATGLRVYSGYSTFTSARNWFHDNVTSVQVGLNASFDDNTSDFSDNTGADVYIDGGTMTTNTTWNVKSDYSVYVSNDIGIAAGTTLTIKPGTVVKFARYNGFWVDGTIDAQGTSDAPIHFTDWRDDTVGGDANKNGTADVPSEGWWRHLRIYNAGSGVLRWCQFAYAGYYDSVCLWKSGAGDLTLDHVTVRKTAGYGVYISGSSGTNTLTSVTSTANSLSGMYLNNSAATTVTSSTFSNNGDYGLLQEFNDTIIYPNNTFTNNTGGSVGVNGGTLNKNLTWTQGIDIVVRNDLTVAAGQTLTIEPGVTVKFGHYTGLWVDGTLTAVGTDAKPITITGTSETKGWWRGAQIRNAGSASLQFCNIGYAGYYDSVNVLKSGTGSLSINDTTTHDCGGDALRIYAGSSAFTSARNHFNTSNYGVRLGIGTSFDDNTSDFSGNAGPDVYVDGGTTGNDVTWSLKPDYSFYMSGDYTVGAGTTMTLKPGTVVKFEQYRSMGVAGTLSAQGTNLAMIHFTDWRDDSVGGDANKNADGNAPGWNWWGHIHAYTAGSISMNWCRVAYGGYYYYVGLWKEGSGNLTLQNSTVTQCYGDGLRINASTGTHLVERSAFTGNWIGVMVSNQTAGVTFSGCQFEGNTSQGTNSYGVRNSNSATVDARSNWWGNDTGPTHTSNPTGTGDRVSNGVLFDPWRRVQATASILSPTHSGTLVAGDTLRFVGSTVSHAGAGYAWDFGGGVTSSERSPGLITLPTVGTTQVTFAPIIDGQVDPFPDTRTFTIVADTGGKPDLRARQMVVPATLAVGQITRINYEVGNVGDAEATGSTWRDAIYLSDDAYLDSTDIELGSATINRTIAAGDNYQGSINVTLPAISEGTHFLILSVNDAWQLTERHRLNNELVNSASVMIPSLTAGNTTSGTLEPRATADGHHYRFDLTESGNLRLHFTGNVTVYVRTGGLASARDYMWQGSSAEDLLLSGLPAGPLFIYVANNLSTTATPYSITAQRSDVVISDVNPPQAAAGSDLTLTVDGMGFTPNLSLTLIKGTTRVAMNAGSLQVFSPRRLTAVFPGGSLAAGTYDLEIAGTGITTVLKSTVVTLNPAGTPHFTLSLVMPDRLGYHGLGTIYVEFGNDGTAPMKAPFILVTSTQKGRRGAIMTLDSALVSQGFWTSAMPAGFATSVQLLGSGEVAGMLMPGEHRRVPVYYTGWLQPWDFSYPPFDFKVSALKADDARTVPWLTGDNLADELRPTGVSDAAWSVIRSNLTPSFGTTVGQFVSRLADNAAYLENLGARTDDVSKLIEFEVSKARGAFHPLNVLSARTDVEIGVLGAVPMLFARVYAHELGARFATGDLGLGWAHVWEYRLSSRADGMKLLQQPGGALRIFAPDQRGGFLSMPGDDATLSSISGGHVLVERDGTQMRFDSAGKLVEARDPNSNTVTLNYTSGLLSSLQHSSGVSFTINRDGSNRIASIADSLGQTVHYGYNSDNRLSTFTDNEGRVTQYTYDNSANAAGSLVTVEDSAGVQKQFRYNAQHFVTQTFAGPEASPTQQLSFSINGAQVAMQDALSRSFSAAYDHRGLMRIVTDPDGQQSYFAFDRALRNTSVLDGQGFGLWMQYDRAGNKTRITDATGVRGTFGFNAGNMLTSHVDGAGQRFNYARDTKGNLLRLLGPDGSSWQWTYDAQGRPLSFRDKSGAMQQYSWNAAGQLTQMSDGSNVVQGLYEYDSARRLTQLTTPSDTVQLSYASGDRVHQVLCADGSRLDFGYDIGGRRTFVSSNKTGHRINYSYDSAGRLSSLTDGSGNSIVQYTYDATGHVTRKTFGNGVYTSYATDAYGRITHQSTHRADNSVLASFDLTYDLAGNLVSHLSDAGEWQMSYDVAGRMITRSFTPAGSASPNREETFSYDAAGELLRRTYNGTTYTITRDAWGHVTGDGLYTYAYDTDGNLISRTGAAGTVTYTADKEGRVTSMNNSAGLTSVTYDAMGALKTSTRPGEGTLRWQLDPLGNGPLAILGNSGNPVESYYQGLGMVAKDTASGRKFPEFDPISGRQLFEITAAGAKVDTGSTPQPPVGMMVANEAGFTTNSSPGLVGGPVYGFGMEPMFPMGPDEVGLLIEGGKAIVNSPYVAKVQSTAADILRNDNFNFGSGVIGIVTSGDLMEPLFNGVMRGGSMLHSGLNKLNIVVTDIPDFNGFANSIKANSSKFDKFGKVMGVLGIAGGGVEMYDSVYGGPKVNYDKLSHGFGTAALAAAGIIAAGTAAAPLVAVAGVAAFISDNTIGLQEKFWYWWDGLDPNPEIVKGKSVGSMDPNEIIGPTGYGTANYRSLDSAFAYKIDFENDPSALAPAQIVTITNDLSSNLDYSGFTLTSVGFGDVVVPVDANNGNFFTTVDIVQNGRDLEIGIDVSFNATTGRLIARFSTLDKETGLPPTVDYGFLPAEDGSGRGKGFVSYSVPPKGTLTTGTEVRNVAVINFDFSYDIATNQVDPHDASKGTDSTKEALVTIDSSAPVAQMNALPANVPTTFNISWSGTDNGSGIASYTVYVSSNGGTTYTPLLEDTTSTSTTFTGTVGTTYRFYVVAIDNVGNEQQVDPGTASVNTLALQASPLTVQVGTAPVLVPDVSTIDFGSLPMGKTKSITFTLKNPGITEISAIALTKDGANASDFTITGPASSIIKAKSYATFTIVFNPGATGDRIGALHITSRQTGATNPFATMNFAMIGAGGLQPSILTHPQHRLANVGAQAQLSVVLNSAVPMVVPITYQWQRNGINVTGATSATYTIPSAALTHAGTYKCIVKNAAGTVTSNTAELGVVDNIEKTKIVVVNTSSLPLALSSAGNGQTFAWSKLAGSLPGTATGATTKTLTLKTLAVGDSGTYLCTVSGPGGLTITGATTVVKVFDDAPVITPAPIPLPDAYVSGDYFFRIPLDGLVNHTPTSFSASGLPSGLGFNTTTGIISGKPNSATTTDAKVVLKAINSKGTATVNTTLKVHALPAQAVGTFNALVDRNTTLSAPIATPVGQKLQGHGGSLENLKVTSTGTFTATLKMEDKSYPMPAASRLDAHSGGNPTAHVVFKRGTGITNLTMDLTFSITDGKLTGTLTDGVVSTPVSIVGWRNPWSTTAPVNLASSRAGAHTAMMDFADSILEGNATYPQGHGFGTLTITTAGAATWSGTLADGTVVTRSTTMGPNGEVPLHWLLYTTSAATAGSAHGWVQVQPGANTTSLDDNLVDTMLDLTQSDPKDQPMFDWMKKPQLATSTTRSYKSGFPLHKLTITGGGYVKPTTGTRVMSLRNATDNAMLTFASANIETSLTYLNAGNGGPSSSLDGKVFNVNTSNIAVMPSTPSAAIANPATLSLTINATTGALSGAFTLKGDLDPTDHVAPFVTVTRSAIKYVGVIVPRLGKGYGCFQLPQLPSDGPPKTTILTSPTLSGQVLFEAPPP